MKNCNASFKFKILEILIKGLGFTAESTEKTNENRKKALVEILPAEGEECIYDLIIY